MTLHDLSEWTHDHVFDQGNALAERGARIVTWVTIAMMVIEITGGWWFNSMALLADGWHMSSHAIAIGLSAFAYAAARRHARDPRYAFGTWKIEILSGFASAIFLLGVAGLMVFGSVERLLTPAPIHYQEAMIIAAIGLVVNIVCAVILGHAHEHTHGHEHTHHDHDDHGHEHHHDLNLKSAYVHVVADAATSVLALVALAGGWFYGWAWLDPVMGLVGAVVVGVWAVGLVKQTSTVLLDREMDHPVVREIREAVEPDGAQGATRITDLHVWRVGRSSYACALSVVTRDEHLSPARVREQLAVHEEIVHVTVEIHRWPATT
ncbi:MAG: CDF family Co(II)/Ni(II) efflux transporter DmeF [Burkholderiales bacterium]|nr:CDF family Co(II)/Ni(II) efflux transporter DmeF [Burkholderiales bacterium]